MHALPPLITPSGTFEFPLSTRTAEHVIAALVEQSADGCPGGARQHFANVLKRDAAFALWVVCSANTRDRRSLQTVDQLAAWATDHLADHLASPTAEQCDDPRPPGKQRSAQRAKRLQALAGQAYSVGQLAMELAEFESLDAPRAQLLGLLHGAADWLAAVARQEPAGRTPAKNKPARRPPGKHPSAATDALTRALPDWLQDALAEVRHSRGRQLRTIADCVAAAKRMTSAKARSASQPRGFQFDRREHDAAVATVQREWQADSAHGGWLPRLAVALQKSHVLACEFQHLLESEKLDALKELAYGAGHEINNPLANISARAQTLLRDEQDPQRRRLLASINVQAFRAHEMIADMMLFARPPEPRKSPVDVAGVVRGVVEELAPQASAQRTEIVYDPPTDPLIVLADATQIAVAIRALAANALEALALGGCVSFEIGSSPAGRLDTENSSMPDETVQITVTDNGPGISPELRRHIFDPFFSGREAGRGLGFGLSKCWRIVRMHGGDVEVSSTEGRGAAFTIWLPTHNGD